MTDHIAGTGKMVPRCEPPEELRGVDGWHWVQITDWPSMVHRWVWDPYANRGFWHPDVNKEARYLSRVATPAEVAALKAERGTLLAARDILARELTALRARVGALEKWGRIITSLTPFGLPEDTATLHGPKEAEAVQVALEALRAALSTPPEDAR